jgi:hypothetical protein
MEKNQDLGSGNPRYGTLIMMGSCGSGLGLVYEKCNISMKKSFPGGVRHTFILTCDKRELYTS